MKNITIIFAILIGTFMSSCSNAQTVNADTQTTENTATIQSVGVEEFEKLIKAGNGLLLDVRTPGENAAGHIEGSKLINISDANFSTNIESLDKNVPVLVYCRSGARSMSAAKIMKSKGFKTIYNLKGGFIAWSNKH